MRVLIDCCLSREWVKHLADAGHEAIHWTSVGPSDAPDQSLVSHAAANGMVLLTHDLDFGTILATQGLAEPSVVQIRSQSHLPEDVGEFILRALEQHESELLAGAILTVDLERLRIRALPLK